MTGAKTIVLAALTFLFPARAEELLPHYEIIELGLPAETYSSAVDVNDQNVVIGTIGLAENEVGFVWKENNPTVLTGFAGQVHPNDINNLGVILGSSLSNGVMRAWAWSNAVDIDLSHGITNASVASAINDLGEIVGSADDPSWYPMVYLWSEPFIRLTPDFAIEATGSGKREISATAINNNHFVTGRMFGGGTLYTNLVEHTEPLQLEAFGGVRTHANPVALNSSNIVAGSFASWAGIPEPATWTLSNGWTVLPSSLKSMIVNGINDAGVMVGTRGNAAKAVIWKDGAGADLEWAGQDWLLRNRAIWCHGRERDL